MYQGYTYTFKSKLQCGAEQWCCSYRQKTGCISVINMQTYGVEVPSPFSNAVVTKSKKTSRKEKLPEWVPIYFLNIGENQYRCNICDFEVKVTEKNLELLLHLKEIHKEVADLHKDNPDSSVGYQIEFLQFNIKDEEMKIQPVILQDICDNPHDYALKDNDLGNEKYVLVSEDDKQEKQHAEHNRKRSWVWKYFEQVTKTIHRCNICNVVLSIKGSNSNNMNRHIRARHAAIYAAELSCKTVEVDATGQVNIKWGPTDPPPLVERKCRKQRRSWVWSYFTLVSRTRARCKLCKRIISHGGNATGNMNRHLKILHNKRGEDIDWVWKLFDSGDDGYSCKICQYQIIKLEDKDKCVRSILDHLKDEHSVFSGSQIITSATFEIKS